MRRGLRRLATSAMLGAMSAAATAAPVPDGWFAFPMVAGEGGLGAAGAASLNVRPAGAAGFIAIRDGHFVDGAGNRIRFFSTNLTATACFPAPADAARAARDADRARTESAARRTSDAGGGG